MITILHGDNFVASRKAFVNHKANLKLNAKTIKPEDLIQSLESNALFSNNHLLAIENLLTLPRSKNKQALIDLVLNSTNRKIILWEKKTITPAVKKQFSRVSIQEFKLTKTIFKFLDSLKPRQSTFILRLLHLTLETDPVELVFYLFHRRISQLVIAKSDPSNLKGAPWQIGKIKSQAKHFKLTQLLNLHQAVTNLDYQIKTGQAVTTLAGELDLLVLKL